MKGYSIFLKAPAFLVPIRLLNVISRTLVLGRASYSLVYSAAPANWALIGGLLPLCRDSVGLFYSPSQVDSPCVCEGGLTPL